MRSDSTEQIERLGLGPHHEDRFWARPGDLTGIGLLQIAESRAGRLQVSILSDGVVYYIDTTNIACMGDLWNIRTMESGIRVAFSGNVRDLTERGVRMGRLSVEPVSFRVDRVIFAPRVRENGMIYLGEGVVQDPNPSATNLCFTMDGRTLRLIPFVSQGFTRETVHGN